MNVAWLYHRRDRLHYVNFDIELAEFVAQRERAARLAGRIEEFDWFYNNTNTDSDRDLLREHRDWLKGTK